MPQLFDTAVLGTFTLLWIAVVPTPGANMLLVTHVAVTRAARDVALALAGNLLGIAILAIAALLGWSALLDALPWLRTAVSVGGGVYLIYFGWRLLARSRTDFIATGDPQAAPPIPSDSRMFGLGLVTALSNAQAVIFITSIFAVTGVLHANLATGLAATAIMIVCNGAYLGLLGLLFQSPPVRAFYGRFRWGLEGIMGLLFVVFGGRLILRDLPWRPW